MEDNRIRFYRARILSARDNALELMKIKRDMLEDFECAEEDVKEAFRFINKTVDLEWINLLH